MEVQTFYLASNPLPQYNQPKFCSCSKAVQLGHIIPLVLSLFSAIAVIALIFQKPSIPEGVAADLEKNKNELEATRIGFQSQMKEVKLEADNKISVIRRSCDAAIAELHAQVKEISSTASPILPIGFIYIQYYSQLSPESLWPGMKWKDVSRTYAGLFFRASGGTSANWGSTQNSCAPRITKMKFFERNTGRFPHETDIPSSGWSEYGAIGAYQHGYNPTWYDESIRFYTEGCEVRPRNQAVKIWKRTA